MKKSTNKKASETDRAGVPPVNPHALRRAEAAKVFREAIQDNLGQLAESLLARAIEGDMDAAFLVLSYAIGEPAKALDLDHLDRTEKGAWQHQKMVREAVENVMQNSEK